MSDISARWVQDAGFCAHGTWSALVDESGNVLQVQSNQAVVCKCALIVWTLPSRQSHTIKIKRPLWKDIN